MCYQYLQQICKVILLKDKRGIKIADAFRKILNESNRKPNTVWVDKGKVFYNRSMKSFYQNIDIEMFSTHNEGKYVIAERFIIALKNKIHKYNFSFKKCVS